MRAAFPGGRHARPPKAKLSRIGAYILKEDAIC